MQRDKLSIRGHRGLEVPHTLTRASEQTTRLAVVLPGFAYRNTMPALYYARSLMLARGADVLSVDYAYDQMPEYLAGSDDEKLAWIRDDVTAALDAVANHAAHEHVTLIGKSAGTAAMAMIVPERPELALADLVWLTPAFRTPVVAEGMARCRNRSLVVIGTADHHFDAAHIEAARDRGATTLVVPDLDHSLEKPNDVVGSLRAMTSIIERLAAWLGPFSERPGN